jgi:hypothetical protein
MTRVEWELYGTTNVDSVVNKTTKGLDGVEKNSKRVENAFSMGLSSIFLRFLGPMALLTSAIAFISKMIDESAKKREEANQAAIDGTNALMSAEDKYYANKLNNEKKSNETVEQAITARRNTTNQFLENDPRGQQIFDEALVQQTFGHPFRKTYPGTIADNPEIQAKVQALIAEDMKNNPASTGARGTPFNSPSGFGNVIGVGANPVLENMTRQLEEQQRQTALLEMIATMSNGDTDFTKGVPYVPPY